MTTHPQRLLPGSEFARDRLTWVAYLMLAWFAYLQTAPGLVIGHLRDELSLSYSVGGLHVAAFAAGSMVAGLISARAEAALGRRTLIWAAAAVMGAGVVGLTSGHIAGVTVGSVLVMGVGGGLLLAMIQAALTDHHGERRAVAGRGQRSGQRRLPSAGRHAVVGGGAGRGLAGRAVGFPRGPSACLVQEPATGDRRAATFAGSAGPPPRRVLDRGRDAVLHDRDEWCITTWGATYVEDATEVSTDTAVVLMAGYFGGVVAGRVLGSRLARRHDPVRLLAVALAVAATGFVILWPSTAPAQALVGLALLGIGLGNLFPMALSVTVALAPGRAALASGRAVAMTSFAVLLAPLAVGTLADVTSLKISLGILPVLLGLAAAGLVLVRRARTWTNRDLTGGARVKPESGDHVHQRR